ncbi:MAG: aminopeptidase [Alphaproteobacteria bacterium]
MIRFLLLAFILSLSSACSSLGYYAGLLNGHAEVLNCARPIEAVLQDPELDPVTRERLHSLQAAREFARNRLGLSDHGSYHSYVKLNRPYVVWNVIATPPFSVSPRQWCYWLAGCFSYRGYYREAAARAYAAQLKREGLDVMVAGVRAYSTLGWFDDPVLSSMLYANEAQRVGVLFHELAHQRIYVFDDSAFNEAFATAVAEEGLRRWFLDRNRPAAYQQYRQAYSRQVAFHRLLLETRHRLEILYKKELAPAAMQQAKAREFARLQTRYRRLTQDWRGDNRYDAWMAQDLNNAHLALVATYYHWVPAFRTLLARADGALPDFYARVEVLAALPPGQRQQRLVMLRAAAGGRTGAGLAID